MDGSFSEFLQMAQVSAQISHDHMVTAFHFLISNLMVPDDPSSFVASSIFDSFSSAILMLLKDFRWIELDGRSN